MKKFFKMLLNVGLYVGIYYAVIQSVMFVFFNYLCKAPGVGEWFSKNPLMFILFNDAIQLALFYFIFKKFKKQNLFEVCGLKKIELKIAGVIFVLGILMGAFTIAFFKVPYIEKQIPDFSNLMNFLMVSGGGPLVFLGFVFLGNFFKETLFRGLLFNEFREALPLSIAIILQGFMYGLLFFNLNIPLTLYAFLGNVIVVLSYIWMKSLLAPIIAQVAIQLSEYALKRSEGVLITNATIPYIMVFSLILILIIMYYLWKCGKQSADPRVANTPAVKPAK